MEPFFISPEWITDESSSSPLFVPPSNHSLTSLNPTQFEATPPNQPFEILSSTPTNSLSPDTDPLADIFLVDLSDNNKTSELLDIGLPTLVDDSCFVPSLDIETIKCAPKTSTMDLTQQKQKAVSQDEDCSAEPFKQETDDSLYPTPPEWMYSLLESIYSEDDSSQMTWADGWHNQLLNLQLSQSVPGAETLQRQQQCLNQSLQGNLQLHQAMTVSTPDYNPPQHLMWPWLSLDQPLISPQHSLQLEYPFSNPYHTTHPSPIDSLQPQQYPQSASPKSFLPASSSSLLSVTLQKHPQARYSPLDFSQIQQPPLLQQHRQHHLQQQQQQQQKHYHHLRDNIDNGNRHSNSIYHHPDLHQDSSPPLIHQRHHLQHQQYPALKRRRRLTADESEFLLGQFNLNDRPTAQERDSFARHLKLDRRTIQVWFQNRRAKLKRDERRPRIRDHSHGREGEGDEMDGEDDEDGEQETSIDDGQVDTLDMIESGSREVEGADFGWQADTTLGLEYQQTMCQHREGGLYQMIPSYDRSYGQLIDQHKFLLVGFDDNEQGDGQVKMSLSDIGFDNAEGESSSNSSVSTFSRLGVELLLK
ncbi:hypothetical protein FBU30_002076 [Linnemannia zychae]|nr:hypothetical protein FBU30_002076 [Linnemannia zychae]